MTTISVPSLEEAPWPTLGPGICAFIEAALVYGPGDLRGEPVKLNSEQRGLIYRIYEVYPQAHPKAGRRRFRRVALSLRKGVGKTEFAAWIAACELHPDAPVRCRGWDSQGTPIGGGVRDPYIPMVAYTEEQSDELAYGTLKVVLEEGPLAVDFDIGLARIMRKGGDGKAVSLAGAPDSRDGARTTFQVCDETHRWVLPRLKAAFATMQANLPKRPLSDPWSLEVTTAPVPGEGSIAEAAMDYAREIERGRNKDARMFYFHRQAPDDCDLSTLDGIKAAIIAASGPDAAGWSDIDGIADQWSDPTTDKAYLERVWLNRPVQGSRKAFDFEAWRLLVSAPGYTPPDGALVTLGFDGSRYDDATAIVGTEVASGTQWLVGLWEKPAIRGEWAVPETDVDDAVTAAFARWRVWRMYADPYWWESWVATWAGRWGSKTVLVWPTNRPLQMAQAVRGFANAITAGEISHSGDENLARHIGNACRHTLRARNAETGEPLWVIQKERPDSAAKIDAAMAAILSWEARTDALAAGASGDEPRSIYEERGLLVL